MWEQFGLRKNPYNILPLLEGGDLPLEEAFVGRKKEKKYIQSLFSSEDRVCLTICGNVGVGKTSMANYEKYYWKYSKKEKPLFSFRREIEADDSLMNKKNFLLEIIGSILREIELIDPRLLAKNDFLHKLNQMVDITQTLGLSSNISAGILGFGLETDITEKQLIPPLHVTTATIEKHFGQLLQFILTHKIGGRQYQGLIVHINNFEIAINKNKKRVIQFFSEIRDFLQTEHVYFIFLGPDNFFKEIIAKDSRVKSIFNQTPLFLAPLTKEELVQAFNKRLEILKSKTARQVIKPFEDAVVLALYELYSGDVRMIMSSLQDIVVHISDKLPKTLVMDEALLLLGRERLSHIETALTEKQMKVLAYIVDQDHEVTQQEISEALRKAPANISNYYFKPLIDYDIIEVKRESGKNKYWGLTEKYLPLKKVIQSQKNVSEQITKISRQPAVFKG